LIAPLVLIPGNIKLPEFPTTVPEVNKKLKKIMAKEKFVEIIT